MEKSQQDNFATKYIEERLSDRTMVERRNLLFAAAFGLVVHGYGGTKLTIPWLDLKTDGLGVELLQGSLAVANLYLLCMFVLYSWDDYRRWTLSKSFVDMGPVFDAVDKLHVAISKMRNVVHDKFERDVDKLTITGWKEFLPLEVAMGNVRNLTQLQWGHLIRNQRHKMIAVQRLRLIAMDIGIPIILSLIAIYKLTPNALPFISRVFSVRESLIK